MQNIINYDDKVALYENSDIADINKVNASDMNEIKTIVNGSLQGTNAMGSIVVDDINCKNLFDKNNYNSLGGFINSSTSKITGNANTLSVYIPIEANTTYTVSKTKGNRFAIATTSATPVFDISLSNIVENNTATSLTLTSSNSAKYLVAYVYNSGADTDTLDSILATLQIEAGSTATTYTPYKKIIKEENGYVKENTIFYANDFKCRNMYGPVISGIIMNNSGVETANSDWQSTPYIEVNSSTDYYYSYSTNNPQSVMGLVTEYNSSKTFIRQTVINANTPSIETTSNTKYVRLSNRVDINMTNIQFELGSEATPYTPYKNFENEEIYSTNEMVIGKWIDGKPLYRKVIEISITTAGDYTYNVANLNIDTTVFFNGYCYVENQTTTKRPLPYITWNNNVNKTLVCSIESFDNNNIYCKSNWNNSKIFLSLEYTKTTSGNRSITPTEEETR